MKRRTRLFLLAAAFLAAALALSALRAHEENAAGEGSLLYTLTADQIGGISCTSADGGTVSFQREDGTWHFADREDLPDQTKVSELAASLTGIRLIRAIRGVTDLSVYGLDAPGREVLIRKTDGEGIRIAIGDDNDMVSAVYCCLDDDRGTVYAVSPALLVHLDMRTEEYLPESKEES